jgi:hypothetical protein
MPELASGPPPPPENGTQPRDTAVDAALLDPERQFLGCLLQLTQHAAKALLTDIIPDDLDTPLARFILELITDVVTTGRDPAPGLVLGHAVTAGRVSGDLHARLSHELITLYQAAPIPLTGKHYKALVLDGAWRRALRTYSIRLQQAAESSSTDMAISLYADRAEVDAIYARYRAAAEPAGWLATLVTVRPGSRPAA